MKGISSGTLELLMEDIFYNPESGIDVTQRNLPHWLQKGKMYFVTFRLADSIPAEKLLDLQIQQREFERKYKPPYTIDQKKLYYHLFFGKMQCWLDDCSGSCTLGRSDCAEIVKNAIKYFDGNKYSLDYWVIMPNHVHVLLLLDEVSELKKIVHSWKSYTAHEINKITGQSGQVWQHESFDHIVRSEYYLEKYRDYIISNKSNSGRIDILLSNSKYRILSSSSVPLEINKAGDGLECKIDTGGN